MVNRIKVTFYKIVGSGMWVVLFIAFCAPRAIGAFHPYTIYPVPGGCEIRDIQKNTATVALSTRDLLVKNENAQGDDPEFREKYKHWQNLSPEKKRKLRKQMHRYKKMSPKDRQHYRQRLKQWKNLPPKERKKIQKDLDRWQNLSPAERDAVRRKFNKP